MQVLATALKASNVRVRTRVGAEGGLQERVFFKSRPPARGGGIGPCAATNRYAANREVTPRVVRLASGVLVIDLR
jgi:hypothetical protein